MSKGLVPIGPSSSGKLSLLVLERVLNPFLLDTLP